MRVGIDARLLHYQRAGISRYILGLLSGLAQIDYDFCLTVLLHRGSRAVLPIDHRVRVGSLLTPCHHRLEQVTLPAELSLKRLDLLHSPDFIPPLYRRCRSVVTVHDLAFLRYPHLLTKESSRYYGQIGRAVNSADAIIAVSRTTKEDLVERLGTPPDRIRLIPEAASSVFRPLEDSIAVAAARSKFGLDGSYFLFVGTVEPRKNLATLVRSYALFQRRWLEKARSEPSPKLAVVGRIGWLYDDVFDLVQRLDLRASVVFLGEVSEADLVLLYNGALALTFVSLYEGFGLPALEAMACGTPVICSDVSALPEVVGTAGFLVCPTDVEAQAEAMWRLAADEDAWETCRRRGLARAAQFSWKQTAEQTARVYCEVVRGG